MTNPSRSHIVLGLAAEMLFAVLPLFVVWAVVSYAGNAKHLLASPEWSFGASILFGQAAVKFVVGLTRGRKADSNLVALTVTMLLVFGLVPSLPVLTLTLHSSEIGNEPSGWLQFFQVILFFGAGCVYLILGTIGEMWKLPEIS